MIDTASIRSIGEPICHFGAIRLRVTGNGNIRPTFQSLDDQSEQVLVPIVMANRTGIELLRLSNFISQRAFLKLETTELDEIFRINRIVVFVKEMWSQYPGI